MNESTRLARDVVLALLGAGVHDVVIAPGSRNAPLSFAAHDAASAGLLRLHSRIDERTAGFLALGLSKVAPWRPAAVMCTSGTAVAQFLPAVMEAAQAGVPLLVVTADRPARLRGTGASQTTDQRDFFGVFAPTLDIDAGADASEVLAFLRTHAGTRPVHLNVQLDGVLSPDASWAPARGDVEPWETPPDSSAEPLVLPRGPRTVVVAGDDAGPPARQLAERAGWPLLAEPTSGCRTGDHVIRTYRLLLDTDLGARIERVVVLGHPTLSRPVTRLLERDDVEVVSVPPRGMWAERPFAVSQSTAAVTAEPEDRGWLQEWIAADAATSRALDRLLAAEPDLTPHEAAGAVSRAVPPGGLLVVGASSPIRDLDLMVAPYRVGDRRKVIANRGLAGIDGTISTAIGAALGRPGSSRALALMGDVTFLHDMTGLVLGPREARPDLTIVVVNDDGGSIFTMLEQGAPEFADRYDTLFGTPHGVDVASLCAATRTPHLRVTTLPELEQALAMPNGGIEVIEVVVRRDNRRDLDARIRALATG